MSPGHLLVLLLLATPSSVGAVVQQPVDSAAHGHNGAPVVVRAETLFVLHGRLGPFGPDERARAAEARILRLEARLVARTDSIAVIEAEGRSELLVRDEVLMTVLDADTTGTGLTRAPLAQAYARRITDTLSAGAEAVGLQALAVDAGKALIATALLVALLLGLHLLFVRLYAMLKSDQVPPLKIKRFELLSSARLGEALTVGTRVIRVFVTLVLFYIYVPLVLSFFPWTAPYSRTIIGYVTAPLQSVWDGFVQYIPNVFYISVIVVVTRYLIKAVNLIFEGLRSGALRVDGFHRDWATPTYNIVRFLIIAFAAVVVFPYLPGSGSDAFKGVSVFVGVLFSFGSSGAVGNIVAGVVLTYTQAFRLGDRVKIGETVGDVVERTLLVTRLRTIKNVEITIPNGAVLANQIINYTRLAASRGLILHTTVTIGYDAPWRQVHQLLIAAAGATEGIIDDPAPFVLQTSLDDFYVSYEINATTEEPSKMAVIYSELHQNIQDQFNKAGVEIMSPHYGALRDGNQVAMPAEGLAPGTKVPAFRVRVDPGA